MTQHQLINKLQDIMPEIVETKNPRAAMLNCAKKNNLSAAQLEKLGHVFNTYKTLVGLDKQASRGASFSIVDVPDMVAEYSTYTPSEPKTKAQKDVHAQINAWMNDADSASKSAAMEWAECFTPHTKAASAKKLPSVYGMLNDYFKTEGGFEFKNVEEGRQWDEEDLVYVNQPDVMHKAATLAKETDTQFSQRMFKEAADHYEDLLFNAQENARRICGEIVSQMRSEDLDWQDVVYDLHDRFHEKTASVVETLEDFFKQAHYAAPHVDVSKRGYTRALAADRYGMYNKIDELIRTEEIYKQAGEELVDVLVDKAASAKDKKDDKDSGFFGGVKGVLQLPQKAQERFYDNLSDPKTSFIGNVIRPEDVLKVREDAREKAVALGALQQLILSDPVLQQADQAEVEDLYHTISNLAPTIAKDPVTVAPVLKEALQYGSLPIQQVKDLISAEKEFQQARKYTGEVQELKNNKLL